MICQKNYSSQNLNEILKLKTASNMYKNNSILFANHNFEKKNKFLFKYFSVIIYYTYFIKIKLFMNHVF